MGLSSIKLENETRLPTVTEPTMARRTTSSLVTPGLFVRRFGKLASQPDLRERSRFSNPLRPTQIDSAPILLILHFRPDRGEPRCPLN